MCKRTLPFLATYTYRYLLITTDSSKKKAKNGGWRHRSIYIVPKISAIYSYTLYRVGQINWDKSNVFF